MEVAHSFPVMPILSILAVCSAIFIEVKFADSPLQMPKTQDIFLERTIFEKKAKKLLTGQNLIQGTNNQSQIIIFCTHYMK